MWSSAELMGLVMAADGVGYRRSRSSSTTGFNGGRGEAGLDGQQQGERRRAGATAKTARGGLR